MDDSQVLMKVTCIPTYFNPQMPQSHQIYEAMLSRENSTGLYRFKKVSPSLPLIEQIYKCEKEIEEPQMFLRHFYLAVNNNSTNGNNALSF
jgi:hypothetical protein